MASPTKPSLSDKETTLLALSWQCFKAGPPEIDMAKLSALGGYTNTGSCRNAMAAIRKKLESLASSAPSTPTASTKSGKTGNIDTPIHSAKAKAKARAGSSTPSHDTKKQKVTHVDGGKLGFADATKGRLLKRKVSPVDQDKCDNEGKENGKQRKRRLLKKEIELDENEDEGDLEVKKGHLSPEGSDDGENRVAIKTEDGAHEYVSEEETAI